VLFSLLIEIDVLPELPLGAAAELEVPGDAELLLELLEALRREATLRRQWRLPPVSSLMRWNTWLYLACVGTCIGDSFEKLNSTLNRLHDGF
jgi:hypothetical protein